MNEYPSADSLDTSDDFDMLQDLDLSVELSDEEILEKRAREMQRCLDEDLNNLDSSQMEILCFTLGEEQYAIESCDIQEVALVEHITRIPCTPSYVEGVINLRGQLIPVLTLTTILGLSAPKMKPNNRLLVLTNEKVNIALSFGEMLGITQLDIQDLLPQIKPPEAGQSDYFRGVTKNHISLIDAKKILSDPNLVVDRTVN